MTTEGERFEFVRKKTGLSGRAFAASLGISPAQASHIITGRRKPSREILEKLAGLYHVNLNWFLTGMGVCFGDEYPEDLAEVRLIRQDAAAGGGALLEDYPEWDKVPVPKDLIVPHQARHLAAVFVRGDSMTGEHICDGDIVIFSPRQIQGDGIYVLSVDGSLLVKRVIFDPLRRRLRLISANPLYPPRILAGPELEMVKIEGRVVVCLHRL